MRVLLESLESKQKIQAQNLLSIFYCKIKTSRTQKELFKSLKLFWAYCTLPRTFVIANVNNQGIKYIKHEITTGQQYEINREEIDKQLTSAFSQIDWFKILGAMIAFLWLVLTFDAQSLAATVFYSFLCGVITLAGLIYKIKNGSLCMAYTLAPDILQRLEQVKAVFASLRESDQVWSYNRYTAMDNGKRHVWKYNAGETILVSKLPAAIFSRSIPNLKTNIQMPGIAVESIALYFLPDKILLQKR